MSVLIQTTDQQLQISAGNSLNLSSINNNLTVEFENRVLNLQLRQNVIGIVANVGPQGAPGLGLPAGGTGGQVLVKASNVNYDTTWGDPSGVANASSTAKGITKLSINPVSPTNPIAVGDNDDRVSYRRAILFIDDGPVEGYASGAFKQTLPASSVFPTTCVWWTSSGMTQKILQKEITYTGPVPTTERWKVYAADGVTILKTVTDVITYSSVFEISRTRTIS